MNAKTVRTNIKSDLKNIGHEMDILRGQILKMKDELAPYELAYVQMDLKRSELGNLLFLNKKSIVKLCQRCYKPRSYKNTPRSPLCRTCRMELKNGANVSSMRQAI